MGSELNMLTFFMVNNKPWLQIRAVEQSIVVEEGPNTPAIPCVVRKRMVMHNTGPIQRRCPLETNVAPYITTIYARPASSYALILNLKFWPLII